MTVSHQPIQDHPDTALVAVAGSIDPATIGRLKTELQALVEDGTRRFIIDCEHLSYINSGGLAYLINLVGEIEPEGGSIALAAVQPKVHIVLKMMGLLDVFKFYPSFADALNELRSEEEPSAEPDVAPPDEAKPDPEPVIAAAPSAPRGNLILQFLRRLFGRGAAAG
jgi:anti-anti-sigma factor